MAIKKTASAGTVSRSLMVELSGNVVLIEGYALTSYTGCQAMLQLADPNGEGDLVAVRTIELRLQSLLETALATGNSVHCRAKKIANPPSLGGEAWSVDTYGIDCVTLFRG